jgi:hypothetical protein
LLEQRPSPPEPSGERRASWLLLLVALVAAALLVWRAQGHARVVRPTFDLLSVVPPGPELLVTADVSALSPTVAAELLRAGGGALLGLREQCGFEPLLALRRFAFAMPFRDQPADGPSDFALIAETALEPEPVLACAETVIRRRGGRPARSMLGAFTSVRDQSKPLGEVAIRADGLFVLSGGRYFREVIDAANGAASGDEVARLRSRAHVAVRRKLGSNQLTVTMLVGPRFPLPGVRAFGFALNATRDLAVRGFVSCYSRAGCGEAHNFLERLRIDAAKEPGMSGLEQSSVVMNDAELELSARLPREQLGPVLKQLLAP